MQKNSILEEKLCFSLYSVTNALIRQYRPLLKEFDLTLPTVCRAYGPVRAGQYPVTGTWPEDII